MPKKKFDVDAAAKRFISGAGIEEETQAPDASAAAQVEESPQLPTAAETAANIPTPHVMAQPQMPAVEVTEAPSEEPKTRGRKPAEKRIQTTIYFSEDQIIALDEQSGRGKKERDKSALVRFGVDMVLAMSTEEYAELKNMAALQGCEPAEIVCKALAQYRGR